MQKGVANGGSNVFDKNTLTPFSLIFGVTEGGKVIIYPMSPPLLFFS